MLTWSEVSNTLGECKVMLNQPVPTIQSHIITYYGLCDMTSSKTQFFENHHKCFSQYDVYMARSYSTRSSYRIPKNFGSDKTWSQLSVDIFIASRTHLGAQKLLIY